MLLNAQQVESEISLFDNYYHITKPTCLALSPGGDKLAIGDAQEDRIVVVDLAGRLQWTVGEKVNLNQPQALCFLNETDILFSQKNNSLILNISRQKPDIVDTLVDLRGILGEKARIIQISNVPDKNMYLLLEETKGLIYRFDQGWNNKGPVISSGSGKGKTVSPAAFAMIDNNKLAIADRKNYPVQVVTLDGQFLYYCGWNLPSHQQGWEAIGVTMDSRGMIWIADNTNSQLRLFDQSGTEITNISYINTLFHPIAMAGTVDNRVVVLDETGKLIFYTLE
jgi:hypothetical protein